MLLPIGTPYILVRGAKDEISWLGRFFLFKTGPGLSVGANPLTRKDFPLSVAAKSLLTHPQPSGPLSCSDRRFRCNQALSLNLPENTRFPLFQEPSRPPWPHAHTSIHSSRVPVHLSTSVFEIVSARDRGERERREGSSDADG